MNEFENFAENYYPQDINSQNNKLNEKNQTSRAQSISFDNLLNVFGGKENALASALLSKKIPNIDFSKDPSSFFKAISQLSPQKKQSNETSKKIDDDFFEEI